MLVLFLCFAGPVVKAGSFADSVIEFSPGVGSGFGQAFFPGNVLGPPHGSDNPQFPTFDEEHLLSFGDGGSITLEFLSSEIVDGPGPDLTVFENPVQPIGSPDQSFSDTAIVSVSDNGTSWTTFPFDFSPPGAGGSLLEKSNYSGFAGVSASLSSPDNGISPFDPAVSGGDSFDLAQIGISRAKFVRITDTGTTGPTQTIDGDGDIVDDPGNHLLTSSTTAGFDLDAVAAINSESTVSAAGREWMLYQ
jgi:hypothetical protein